MADPAPPSGTPDAVLVVGWPIGPDDLAMLCEQVATWLSDRAPGFVLCDVTALTGVDLGAVDCLARLQLAARRNGGEIRLTNACGELVGLLHLVGLAGVVPTADGP